MAIKETIDESIERLVQALASADDLEARRIHARIQELESLKKEHTTT